MKIRRKEAILESITGKRLFFFHFDLIEFDLQSLCSCSIAFMLLLALALQYATSERFETLTEPLPV